MTNQQETAAIALCGAHPILLVGGETSEPATDMGEAMGKALPRLVGKRCAETEANWKRGGVRRGKYQDVPPVITTTADDPVLQEPTHPIGCAELAHNGVLARTIQCAVTRRYSSAGANPARQLSLQPVAVGADDGGNDIG